ncbi:14083_t:CDS:1, partial [Funneliformis mosseae]
MAIAKEVRRELVKVKKQLKKVKRVLKEFKRDEDEGLLLKKLRRNRKGLDE